MSLALSLTFLEQVFTKTFGSIYILSLAIIVVILLMLLFAGLDLRVGLLLTMPLFAAFGEIGWLPQYITGLAWILFVGFGMFMIWNYIRER